MDWYYKDQAFESDQILNAVGFVYLIDCLANNKRYIGKKLFTKAKTKQVKGKKKKIRVESDWKNYYGSNEKIQKDLKLYGPTMFRRTILHICYSKGDCSYLEAQEQFRYDVLRDTHYYNDFIGCKIHRKHLKQKLVDSIKVP